MSSLLIPFGKIYGWAMDARNALYDRGIFRVHDLGVRTISVGNLTTGGTGKTPLVAMIAKMLAERGETVCILTRGYGRKNAGERVLVSDGKSVLVDAATGGDEPVELARKLIGKAIVISHADRVAAGNWAKEKFGVTAFILDDGFQHRRVKRDLDIVCIDATNPLGGNSRVLPAGTLRESFEGLKRADAIIVTRTDLVDSTDALRERLRKCNSNAPIFEMSATVSAISPLEAYLHDETTSGDNASHPAHSGSFAFCGLGNPENFRTMLEKHGMVLSGFKAFGDHKKYTQADIDDLENDAGSGDANFLLTTAKDSVKLAGLNFALPVFVVEIEPHIDDNIGFEKLLP
jgi:tetraacyldisaccharide 4'-kinase